MKIDIQYTKDEEMISAYCLKDEIKSMVPDAIIDIINPKGINETKRERVLNWKL